MFLILLPFRLVCFADGILAAIGTLLRLAGAAEDEMALITDKNHFHHRGISIPAFPLIINYKFPQEGAARPFLFYARRRDFFEETKLLGSLQPQASQILCPDHGRGIDMYLHSDARLCPG